MLEDLSGLLKPSQIYQAVMTKWGSSTVSITISLPLDLANRVHQLTRTFNVDSRSLMIAFLIHQGDLRLRENYWRERENNHDNEKTESQEPAAVEEVDEPSNH